MTDQRNAKQRTKLAVVLVMVFLSSVFVILPYSGVPIAAALAPNVRSVASAQFVTGSHFGVGTSISGVQTGDTLLFIAEGALRGGTNAGIQVIFNSGPACSGHILSNVVHTDNTHGTDILIATCASSIVLAGTYSVNASWGATCVLPAPCGFVGIWILDLNSFGNTLLFTNTSGVNTGSSLSGAANFLSFAQGALAVGASVADTGVGNTQSPGGGFSQIGTCPQSGTDNSFPLCAADLTATGAGTTSFPWSYSVSGPWGVEGVLAYIPGPITLVQVSCHYNSAVPELSGSATTTFAGAVSTGDDIFVSIAIQGSANTAITNVNVTDNVNAGSPHYKLWLRTTDQANTLYVGAYSFNLTTGVGAGGFTVTAKYAQSPNSANQNIQVCAYEIAGATNRYTAATAQQEGGSLPISTITTGDFTFAAAVGNAGGGAYAFSGVTDSSNGNLIGGHKPGTFSGLTSITFVEELDMSISLPALITTTITTTLTVTGMVAPNLTGDGNWQWLIGLFFLLFPVAILDSMVVTPIGPSIRGVVESHVEGDTVIFTTLLGLFIGSIIGVMPTINALPLAFPFMFGVLFVVYWYVGRK